MSSGGGAVGACCWRLSICLSLCRFSQSIAALYGALN
jgi:hypothetical protein